MADIKLNLAIVGDAGTGKTAWLTRLITGEFVAEYVPTLAGQNYTLPLQSNYGGIIYTCVEGQNASVVTDDTDGVVVFYDVKNREGPNRAIAHRDFIRQFYPDLPVVLAGNKVDLKGRNYTQSCLDTIQYLISAKSNYRFEKPLLFLARKFTGHDDFEFVASPAVAPPEVIVSKKLLNLYGIKQNKRRRMGF